MDDLQAFLDSCGVEAAQPYAGRKGRTSASKARGERKRVDMPPRWADAEDWGAWDMDETLEILSRRIASREYGALGGWNDDYAVGVCTNATCPCTLFYGHSDVWILHAGRTHCIWCGALGRVTRSDIEPLWMPTPEEHDEFMARMRGRDALREELSAWREFDKRTEIEAREYTHAAVEGEVGPDAGTTHVHVKPTWDTRMRWNVRTLGELEDPRRCVRACLKLREHGYPAPTDCKKSKCPFWHKATRRPGGWFSPSTCTRVFSRGTRDVASGHVTCGMAWAVARKVLQSVYGETCEPPKPVELEHLHVSYAAPERTEDEEAEDLLDTMHQPAALE